MTTATPADPIVSEFETLEQEAEHTAWIRAELERRAANPSPGIPHDEVIRRMEARLALWEQRRKKAA
jgi:hypothetical protein